MTSARAIEARICMPPESSRGNCRAKPASPTSSSAAATSRSARRARRRREIERQPDVRVDARPRHQRRRLEHESRDGVRDRRSPRNRRPTSGASPCVRREQARDQIEQRRLAAARGPEQRDELAAADGEVDRRERLRAVRVASCARRRPRRRARRRRPCARAQGRTFTSFTIDERIRLRVVDAGLGRARRRAGSRACAASAHRSSSGVPASRRRRRRRSRTPSSCDGRRRAARRASADCRCLMSALPGAGLAR